LAEEAEQKRLHLEDKKRIAEEEDQKRLGEELEQAE